MMMLMLALGLFVGTHFLMSHALRPAMVARLGEQGFQIVYSLISLATLGWAIWLYRGLEHGAPLWPPLPPGSWIVLLLMALASVLLAGSLVRNPGLAAPGAAAAARMQPRGMLAVTRHPMMWSFVLWAAAHILAKPTALMMALAGAIALLALGGAAGQDAKKDRLMGIDWTRWRSRTAFVPLAGQLSGRIGWAAAWPGFGVLAFAAIIFAASAWLHVVPVGPFALR